MTTHIQHRRSTPTQFLIAVVALVIGSFAAPTAKAQFEVYDNFNRSVLNVKKWPNGWMSANVYGAKRKIENGALTLYVYGRSDTDSDTGGYRARQQVKFPEGFADTVSAIEFTGKVTKANVRGCDTEPNGLYRARLTNYITWGNDGSSTGPDDLTGDFRTQIGLRRFAGSSSLSISTFIFRCNDPDCNDLEDLRSGIVPSLGTVAPGQTFTLSQSVKRDANQVVFKSKIGNTTRTQKYPYRSGISPIVPTADDFTAFMPQTELDNCLTTGKKPFGFIEAKINSVSIKPR